MSEKIEIIEEDVQPDEASLLATVRRILLAGVGAVVLAQSEVEEFVHKLMQRGEIAEHDGRSLIKYILERRRSLVQSGTSKAEAILERRVEALLERMNVPTKSEIDALAHKIAALSDKIELLRQQLAEHK